MGVLGLGVSEGLTIPVTPGLIEKGDLGDSCILLSFCVRSRDVPLPRLLLRKSRWLISSELTCLKSGMSTLLIGPAGVAPKLEAGALDGSISVAIESNGGPRRLVSYVLLLRTPGLRPVLSPIATPPTEPTDLQVALSNASGSRAVAKSWVRSEAEGAGRGR